MTGFSFSSSKKKNPMLWGHLKDRVWKNKPATIQALKTAIRQEMGLITVAMVDRTIEHLQHVRLPLVLQRQDAHLKHLL